MEPSGAGSSEEGETEILNKSQLVTEFSLRYGLSDLVAQDMVESVLQIIARGIKEDGKMMVSNFGVFSILDAKGRKFVTPAGEVVRKGPSKRVKFHASPNLIDFVRGGKVPVAVGLPRGRQA